MSQQSQWREKLMTGVALSKEESIEVHGHLEAMFASEGWELVQILLLRHRQEMLELNSTDGPHSQEFYRGAVTALGEFIAGVNSYNETGKSLAEEQEPVRRRAANPGNFFPGGGGFRGPVRS